MEDISKLNKSIPSEEFECTLLNPKKVGRYGNILVVLSAKTKHLYSDSLTSFKDEVEREVEKWTSDTSISAVWFNVHVNFAYYIPILHEIGFSLHRIEGTEFIALYKWLFPGKSKIPEAGTHIGGACGMVIRYVPSSKDGIMESHYEVLCIREKHRSDWWEFPGGAVERGEYFVDVAVREVEEEVGLKTVPVGFVGLWDELGSRYNCNSCYVGILVTLDNEEKWDKIILQEDEILEAKWVNVDDIMKQYEILKDGPKGIYPKVNGIPLSAPAFVFIEAFSNNPNSTLGKIIRNRSKKKSMSGRGWFLMST